MTQQGLGPGRLRARRNLRLATVGVLAVCLGGLGAAVLYSSIAHSESVVALRRTVYRGQVITADDLGAVSLASSPGVETVPAAAVAEVVGRTALYDLVEGSLLGQRSFGDPQVAVGTALLGVRLSAGKLPWEPLPPGTPVLLVAVSSDGSPPPGPASFVARVAALGVTLPDGATLVDVAVGQDDAAAVARMAAADRLALVRLPEVPR